MVAWLRKVTSTYHSPENVDSSHLDPLLPHELGSALEEVNEKIHKAVERHGPEGSKWPSYGCNRNQPVVYKKFSPAMLERMCLTDETSGKHHDEFWYSKQDVVVYDDPKEETGWDYGRIVTMDSWVVGLACSFFTVVGSFTTEVSMFTFQLAMWTDFGFSASAINDSRWFVGASVIYILCMVYKMITAWLRTIATVNPPPPKEDKVLDSPPPPKEDKVLDSDFSEKPQPILFLAMLFLQYFRVPLSVTNAPVVFHIRKASAAFATTKMQKRRVWILGYLSKEQYLSESDGHGNHDELQLAAVIVLVCIQATIVLQNNGGHCVLLFSTMISILGKSYDLYKVSRAMRWKSNYKRTLIQRKERLKCQLEYTRMSDVEKQQINVELEAVGRLYRTVFKTEF